MAWATMAKTKPRTMALIQILGGVINGKRNMSVCWMPGATLYAINGISWIHT